MTRPKEERGGVSQVQCLFFQNTHTQITLEVGGSEQWIREMRSQQQKQQQQQEKIASLTAGHHHPMIAMHTGRGGEKNQLLLDK